MAVRFDAGGDYLQRLAAGIVAADANTFSFCLWAKRKVDTNTYAAMFYTRLISDGDGAETWIETEANGDDAAMYENESVFPAEAHITGPAMTIDTWFFFSYRRTNTSRSFYYGTESGGTLTKGTNTDTKTFTTDMDELWLGNDSYSEPFNGELAWARLWAADLSDAEMDAEWRSTTPVRATNLRGDWRLTSAATATTDSSGNSLTLTAGGTLTDGGTNPTPPVLSAQFGKSLQFKQAAKRAAIY